MKSTIEGIKVGDRLILVSSSRYHSDTGVIVTRIGRKYVYVARWGGKGELSERFELATGIQDSDYGSPYRLYTPAAYEERARRTAVRARLRKAGLGYDSKLGQYSTDKLERVAEILEAEE